MFSSNKHAFQLHATLGEQSRRNVSQSAGSQPSNRQETLNAAITATLSNISERWRYAVNEEDGVFIGGGFYVHDSDTPASLSAWMGCSL